MRVVVVGFEDQVETFQTVRAPVRDEVAWHEGIVRRAIRQTLAGALTLDTHDLISNIHGCDGTESPRKRHAGTMRIVAGTARGRRLVVPKGTSTRPTTDRVREAVFNTLFSLDAIEDLTYCDLFAGSGALGLEALSRGAARVTFVERDRDALAALRTNITTLGFGDRSTVVTGESLGWLRSAPHHDVVLADPPYGFKAWVELLETADAAIIVAESNGPVQPVGRWQTRRERRYGSTVVTILDQLEMESGAPTKESTL